MRCLSRIAAALLCLALVPLAGPARAQLDLIERAMPIISDFATEVCQDTDTRRTVERGELSAELEARLRGFLGRLAEIGGSIEGSAGRETSEGVLPEDLPQLLAQQRECRQTVFLALLERLVPLAEAPASGDTGAAPGGGTADPNAFIVLAKPEFHETRTWSLPPVDDSRNILGEIHWYSVALIKQTHLPLPGCRDFYRLIGPADWVAARETWGGYTRREAVRLSGRYEALGFPGPTRIGLWARIGVPNDTTPPAHVDVELLLECDNYETPPLLLRFEIAP